MKRETFTIDATNKVLGRLATEIATILRGKHKEDFAPNKDSGDCVVIKNFSKIKITGKKLEQKKFYRHSGYMGGLKKTPLSELFANDPAKVMKRAVWGMLPINKLRKEQIKRLKVEL